MWTRRVSVFDGPLGPPPALLGLTVGVYALCGVALVGVGVVAVILGLGWQLLRFCSPIALYCGALAWTASRIRSRSPKHRASAWMLAPVVLHGVMLLAGTLTIVWEGTRPHEGVGPHLSRLGEVSLLASAIGVVFGWAPALSPLFYGRRAGWFFVTALPGLVLVVVLLMIGVPRWL